MKVTQEIDKFQSIPFNREEVTSFSKLNTLLQNNQTSKVQKELNFENIVLFFFVVIIYNKPNRLKIWKMSNVHILHS